MKIPVAKEKLTEFCQRHHIRKLSFFGSVLRDNFRADSDIDVLVEFEEGFAPGFFRFIEMQMELSRILERQVDLNTPQDLSRYFRQKVLDTAQVQYERR